MKTIIHLLYLLLLTPTLLFAQNDEELHLKEEHKKQVYFEQNLTDFNAKIHNVIISSYKGFETIIRDKKTSIDFEKGVDEVISNKEGEKYFSVVYSTSKDELLAIALQKELVSRILVVSPKGFIKTETTIDGKKIVTIQYNDENQDKASYQPITKVILDYASSSVKIKVIEPNKK
jgi:hypothetical protein